MFYRRRTREWSDQRVSTYRNWKQGQPDNVGGKQNCTATDLGNAGLWSDEDCSRELVFICHGEKGEWVCPSFGEKLEWPQLLPESGS